ncbi:MAG: FAD-binding oxidoreductase [Acidobacteriaceae bacterium]|nr:FAD-binding oxidoreductase [Acidobacteriaceae bacterium]
MPVVEDASGFTGHADYIVSPATTDEVARLLNEANRDRVPVTISGAGTGVTGGRVPQGGHLLSLDRFKKLDIQTGCCRAGAGVPLSDLQSAAAQTRQFYAPDPTEWTASVGGSIATNASGSRSFRYGSTRRHVLALTTVFMDGSVRKLRRGDTVDFDVPALPLPDVTKSTAGYLLRPGMDWIDLITGSEGTLAVVVEAELQLLPAPADLLSGVIFFQTDDAALDAVDSWRSIPGLRMLEYFDRNSLDFLRQKYSEVPAGSGAALLIEDDAGDVDAWVDRLPDENSWFALSDQDRERFRRFRHALPELVNETMHRRGFLKLGSDFAVPVARNREMLSFYHEQLQGLDYVIFGHIGDAHVHVNILPESQADFERGKELMTAFARQAVKLGGTVSAEHGLGKRKSAFLAIQYTPEQIEAMKAVKRRLDPNWLLGRGNLFGDQE